MYLCINGMGNPPHVKFKPMSASLNAWAGLTTFHACGSGFAANCILFAVCLVKTQAKEAQECLLKMFN